MAYYQEGISGSLNLNSISSTAFPTEGGTNSGFTVSLPTWTTDFENKKITLTLFYVTTYKSSYFSWNEVSYMAYGEETSPMLLNMTKNIENIIFLIGNKSGTTFTEILRFETSSADYIQKSDKLGTSVLEYKLNYYLDDKQIVKLKTNNPNSVRLIFKDSNTGSTGSMFKTLFKYPDGKLISYYPHSCYLCKPTLTSSAITKSSNLITLLESDSILIGKCSTVSASDLDNSGFTKLSFLSTDTSQNITNSYRLEENKKYYLACEYTSNDLFSETAIQDRHSGTDKECQDFCFVVNTYNRTYKNFSGIPSTITLQVAECDDISHEWATQIVMIPKVQSKSKTVKNASSWWYFPHTYSTFIDYLKLNGKILSYWTSDGESSPFKDGTADVDIDIRVTDNSKPFHDNDWESSSNKYKIDDDELKKIKNNHPNEFTYLGEVRAGGKSDNHWRLCGKLVVDSYTKYYKDGSLIGYGVDLSKAYLIIEIACSGSCNLEKFNTVKLKNITLTNIRSDDISYDRLRNRFDT